MGYGGGHRFGLGRLGWSSTLRLPPLERLLPREDEQTGRNDDEDADQCQSIGPFVEEQHPDGQGPEDLAVLSRSEPVSRSVHGRDDKQGLRNEGGCGEGEQQHPLMHHRPGKARNHQNSGQKCRCQEDGSDQGEAFLRVTDHPARNDTAC
jgi:hypothetical protein